MITQDDLRILEHTSELAAIQTLKLRGELNVMKSERHCKKVYGRQFIEAVDKGILVGVITGGKTLYSIEDIIALQILQLQESKKQRGLL